MRRKPSHLYPINHTHSEMVKFHEHDEGPRYEHQSALSGSNLGDSMPDVTSISSSSTSHFFIPSLALADSAVATKLGIVKESFIEEKRSDRIPVEEEGT